MLKEVAPEAEICLEAEDGEEILEYLQEHTADLVLTDIRMPEKDGLAVAEYIRNARPEISVAIVSGYTDFAYASAAIRFGVEDYLTKPVKKEELSATLSRIFGQRARKRQAVEQEVKSRVEQAGMYYMEPEKVFWQDGLIQSLLPEEIRASFSEGTWRMAVIQPCERIGGWSRERIAEQQEYFCQHLERLDVWAYYFSPREEFVLLTRSPGQGVSQDYLPLAAAKTVQALLRDRGISFSAGISGEHAGLRSGELAEAYREAVIAVCGRLLGERSGSFVYQPGAARGESLGREIAPGLKEALLENRREDARRLIGAAIESCRREKDADIYGLFGAVLRLLGVMNEVFREREADARREDAPALLFSMKSDLYSFRTREELLSYLYELADKVSGEERERQGDVVGRVLAYVEENYQYDMTLTELANRKFFMNPSYLSRVFKARTGQTFSRYLIAFRMKRAAQLLENRGLRISDVAQYVGYNDTSYFIQTFKKYYGMTPEQYRTDAAQEN